MIPFAHSPPSSIADTMTLHFWIGVSTQVISVLFSIVWVNLRLTRASYRDTPRVCPYVLFALSTSSNRSLSFLYRSLITRILPLFLSPLVS
ncbi:hypothetical protein DAEQUDRAFT_554333 [Daedalea quercina L-15889]|uniref:Uncharacterized protein n=1 Tax=Daedalea quercina L-15889 TaxID=1314783 RepID=A0A165T504_9APHY|nr:hypothetical protein DAEQUDRAFT_554333 [Daedalea quercina L-15889]